MSNAPIVDRDPGDENDYWPNRRAQFRERGKNPIVINGRAIICIVPHCPTCADYRASSESDARRVRP